MIGPWLQVAYPRTGASWDRQKYNTAMSAVRVAVEWNYKDLKQMLSFNEIPRALKVRQRTLGLV